MAEDKATAPAVVVGEEVTGTVEHIAPYGAFIRLATGQKAMVHISELAHEFVKKVEDVLQIGQQVRARVIKIDERGRIDLSVKALKPRETRRHQIPDDFEKRLSNFLKSSEEKISELNSKMKAKGGGKRRGTRG